MITTATTPIHTADLPIIVHDRRRRGFYTIDNEVIDRYGTVLKAHGVAVLNVLARFANRDGECFPSQSTIAKRLGMCRMQVSREINKLEKLHLIEVEPQFGPNGEQRANLYILCDIPKDTEPVTHRYTPGNSELHPPVTERDTPCNRELHKQNTKKNTQTEQDPEKQQAVVVAAFSDSATLLSEQTIDTAQTIQESSDDNRLSGALLTLGLAESVVERLVQSYSREHIAEKIDYLAFLQAEAPEKVRHPQGWLRRAIEENYGAPDGYLIPAEHDPCQPAEVVTEAWLETLPEGTEQKRTKQAEAKAAHDAYLQSLHTEFGTTEADQAVWKDVQQELSYIGRPDIYAMIADAEILKRMENSVLIGIPTESHLRKLSHPGIQTAIKRALTHVVGRTVTPEFVLLGQPNENGGWNRSPRSS